ncbi:NUDIX hydrolase [Streptomyces sp. NPDC001935]
MPESTPAPKTRRTGRVVHRTPWMTVREEEFVRADGGTGQFTVVTRADFVVVLCDTPEGLLMTEQYRYAAARWSLELPQGGLEPGESAAQAALRELREETGWHGGSAEILAEDLYEAADWATQRFTVVRVRGGRPGPASPEADEAIAAVRGVPRPELAAHVLAGRVVDAATLAALAVESAKSAADVS